jgi:predicted HicB family RNase H-like nuclease
MNLFTQFCHLKIVGSIVNNRSNQPGSYPLRLATSLRERAEFLAAQDGVSLNHFINLAVAEKISRLEADSTVPNPAIAKQD